MPAPENSPKLVLTDAATAEDEAVIRDGLGAYNLEKRLSRPPPACCAGCRSGDTARSSADCMASTSMGLLRVDRFFLPETLRKQARRPVSKAAEEEGARHGCTRAVLSTLSFQAPGFYRRQGWDELGRIECDPPGHTRFMMTKSLAGR